MTWVSSSTRPLSAPVSATMSTGCSWPASCRSQKILPPRTLGGVARSTAVSAATSASHRSRPAQVARSAA